MRKILPAIFFWLLLSGVCNAGAIYFNVTDGEINYAGGRSPLTGTLNIDTISYVNNDRDRITYNADAYATFQTGPVQYVGFDSYHSTGWYFTDFSISIYDSDDRLIASGKIPNGYNPDVGFYESIGFYTTIYDVKTALVSNCGPRIVWNYLDSQFGVVSNTEADEWRGIVLYSTQPTTMFGGLWGGWNFKGSFDDYGRITAYNTNTVKYTPTSMPEPSAVILFLTGLAGLVGIRNFITDHKKLASLPV